MNQCFRKCRAFFLRLLFKTIFFFQNFSLPPTLQLTSINLIHFFFRCS